MGEAQLCNSDARPTDIRSLNSFRSRQQALYCITATQLLQQKIRGKAGVHLSQCNNYIVIRTRNLVTVGFQHASKYHSQ